MAPDQDPKRAKARIASIVILVTMVVWMGASWIGGQIGLPTRFAFLFDFAALAALFWALVVLFQVWRESQKKG
ncbi:hypothetical protein GCM10008927_19070 [Amylibacter ulvae]|uniref:DUF5337 domain-containing protein n=1 Tax=Paramylibacter ulvae TaxID=1651968 RepID=A0ABQ3D335_9RHOB|nr:DUF5337 domain-containing protein [Amylibacter ulvae]GHA53437.1 hypothetical protein GCM10008927_19070 [Amylibacter ulvae]